MPVRRPANGGPVILYDDQAVSVGERKIPIAEFGEYQASFRQFSRVERLHDRGGQGIDEREKLTRACLSYRRRNHPWPSAITRADVTRPGGDAKSRLKVVWSLSDDVAA